MSLFSEFPPISKEEWLAKIEKDLKGKIIESLNWEINKDWIVSPIVHRSDRTIEGAIISNENQVNNSWEIGERIIVENAKTANKEALQALEGGVNALLFELPSRFEEGEFEILLKGIELEWISIHFEANESIAFSAFLDYIQHSATDASKIKGSWRNGSSLLIKQADLSHFKLFSIDGRAYYKDTTATVEELVNILVDANQILKDIEPPQANNLQVIIAIGESYFINIAKIRALKILWYNLMKAYQLNIPIHLEAHLSTSNLTDDQHQNMIQMSIQALSAVIGGIDRLFLTPASDSNTTFTKRIARNVQHLLQMESNLDKLIDPSAGSYYIENLTNELANRSWKKSIHLVE